MSEQSTLEDLLVDEEALNEELLAETVGRYAQIGKDSGDLIPNERYNDLNSKRKIVVALMAQKALHELGMADDEWVTPSDISSMSGVKKGTVYPSVRDLDDEGILRSEDGEYMLPSVNLEKAKEFLAED
ncbi:hypothetical protein [Haloglomus litoreum]|uniref:hypothetical protein n=1 Tax=Haloglomus litoreum TaxID=3034026 RepID=UPI0023E8674F|nr:hypothetical protein [Haloglomus sp. DT116]